MRKIFSRTNSFSKTLDEFSLAALQPNYNGFLEVFHHLGWREQNFVGAAIIMFDPTGNFTLRISTDNDWAFPIYADICLRNADNPYLQNIYGHKTLSDGTHVTIMERLHKTLSQKSSDCETKPFESLYGFLSTPDCNELVEEHFLRDQNLCEALRLFYMAIDEVIDGDHNLGTGLDLHRNNIMLRKKDDDSFGAVLIDPFENGNPQDFDRETKVHLVSDATKTIKARDVMLRRKLGLIDAPYLKHASIEEEILSLER